MFKKNATETGSNFWISYADLMAGLLFVFILLIGAIVSKSIILKSALHQKEERLSLVSETLHNREKKLNQLSSALEKSRVLLEEKEHSLMTNKALLKEKEVALAKSRALLDEKNLSLKRNKRLLELKADEIEKLNKMLLKANTQRDLLSKKVVIVQNLLDETNATLQKHDRELAEYKGEVIVLSNQLTEAEKRVNYKDKELLKLLNALDEKKTKYDTLVANLQAKKAKIKSITGIKLKVIAALKDELGDKIDIDKKSGSLRLASNILFDKGSSQLKEDAKAELKEAFEEYIGILVTSSKIKPHLDKIIIEGHTDSDGGYLYNLNLSQKRAFAVMKFLLTLDFVKKYNIQPLMIASGRAYLDAITVNGVEDKDASRRIEIKFRLKNEDAMQEIEKVLDAE